MRGPAKVILEKIETDYLRAQIDHPDNTRIKVALQSLCRSYRRGVTIHPSLLIGVVSTVTGTAFRPTLDEKARRWILNALARIGKQDQAMPAVLHLLRNHSDEPQTVAAGIAAVYKLCKRGKPEDALTGLNFDPQMRTLAALQHVPVHTLDMEGLPVDVEVASADVLRLALLVVGLGRSPENLLNPRHTDGEMVRALGGHHDPLVSQYTIWAITENDQLGIANLGVPLKDIEGQPDNVRAWMFQLLAMEADAAHSYWDIIRLGSNDPMPEARRGLAQGLAHTFVDVFEPWILEWVTSETDPEVQQLLLSHIVRQAVHSPNYAQYALAIYEGEAHGSALRQSMEASAVRTPIYTLFKRLDAKAQDLFSGGGLTMVKNQINIGSVQGGAIAVGDGTATNYGTTNVQVLTSQQVETAQAELAKLEGALHDTEMDHEQKSKALAHVKAAKEDPSPGKISKVVEFIGSLGNLAEAGSALAPYVAALGGIIGLPTV